MSCLIITSEIRELAKKFPNETEQSVLNLVSLWQEKNNKSIEDIPMGYELQDFIKELRKSDFPTFIANTAKNVSSKGKTQQYGVAIDPKLKTNYAKWQSDNPAGIVAYRVNFNKYNTPEEAQAGRIGNPFSEGIGQANKGEDTVQKFFTWLTTGNNFGEAKATEEYRQAIIDRILSSSEDTPILYYKELGRPSHATVIGYLIRHKDLLSSISSRPEPSKWARTAENGYEVSTRGDKRFSALVATFKKGTVIDGVDVGGRTIEDVYQSVIKKSRKGQAPSKDSKLYRTTVSSYSGDITPDANTIFVFGSNPEGRHGAGAAKVARKQFGAIYGQGEGLQGNAYALPTKDLRVKENNSLRSISPEQIIESIKKLYETARQNPDKQFKVAYRNTDRASLNGYTGLEMIDMFLKAGSIPTNIVFSKEWVDTGKFNLSKGELEDFSYTEGYLPLWQEWARQNPELIEELRKKSRGKVLTDQFASTRVSQARALTQILNETQRTSEAMQMLDEALSSSFDTSKISSIEEQAKVDLDFDPRIRSQH